MSAFKVLFFIFLISFASNVAFGKMSLLDDKGNKPTLLENVFEWAEATLRSDCKTFDLLIRYDCTEDTTMPFEDGLFDRVCDEVIPAGLRLYYGGQIEIGGVEYTVNLNAEKATNKTQSIILKRELVDCVGKSYNNVVIPIVAYYCDDIQFKYTISHEFGHGNLIPADGPHYSATHKGTSTLAQVPRNDSDIANCDGSVTFDLMHYYKEYNDNCKDAQGIRGPNFYEKAMGTEADKNVLLFHAQTQLQQDKTCGIVFAEECQNSAECLAGLQCDPAKKICVECMSDSDCDLSTQYCHDLNHGSKPNTCLDKRRPFEACDHDQVCLYGYCNLEVNECGSKGESGAAIAVKASSFVIAILLICINI